MQKQGELNRQDAKNAKIEADNKDKEDKISAPE
jgi:hypothetical protein